MSYPVVIRELPSQNEVDYRFIRVAGSAINNGMAVIPGNTLVEGYRDVYTISASPSSADDFWIATGVEAMYETGKHLDDYINEAGTVFRIERLVPGAIYAISSDGLNISTPATDMVPGAYVAATYVGTFKMVVAATAPETLYTIGRVIDVYTKGGKTFVSIMFQKPVSNS